MLRALGRRSRRASRSTGRTSRGATSAYTFWDLQQQANRLSNALAALGVRRGDKVALILPQRPETVVAHIAVYQMGAIAVPLSFLFGPDALEYRLNDSEAQGRVRRSAVAANLAPIRDRCRGIAHVIGVAGAREAWITPYETLHRAARRRTSTPSTRAPAIRRSSSTRAARPGRPRAR